MKIVLIQIIIWLLFLHTVHNTNIGDGLRMDTSDVRMAFGLEDYDIDYYDAFTPSCPPVACPGGCEIEFDKKTGCWDCNRNKCDIPRYNKVKDMEENVDTPSGRDRFVRPWRRPPRIPSYDACGHTRDTDLSRWNDSTILSIGSHTYCGPYTNYYEDNQYPVVCHRWGVTVQKCEEICGRVTNCTCFNWSGRGDLGCVLRDCGNGNPQNPIGVNSDFHSFSYRRPSGMPECHP